MSILSILLILFAVGFVVGECAGPTCSGDQATCASITGCGWSNDESGDCRGPGESCYAGTSESACKSITNCAWRSTGSSCSRPTKEECSVLTKLACSAASSGCQWVDALSNCTGPSEQQCRTRTQTECQVEGSGCSWQSYVSQGWCTRDENECQGLSPTTCDSKAGCKWQPGYCEDFYCLNLSKDACEVDDRCRYIKPRGACQAPQNNVCRNLSPTACSTIPLCQFTEDQYYCKPNNPGAQCSYSWDGSRLTCGDSCTRMLSLAGECQARYNCYDNNDGTGCSEGSTSGCIWNPLQSRGRCTYNAGCEGLLEDVCNARVYCGYQHPRGDCGEPEGQNCQILDEAECKTSNFCQYRNEEHFCLSNTDGNPSDDCSLVSKGNDEYECEGSNGCELWTRSGYCENSCFDNEERSGCTEDSGEGCIFKATYIGGCEEMYFSGSWGYQSDQCVNNNANTGCATDSPSSCSFSGGYCSSELIPCPQSENDCSQPASKDMGCVWKPASTNGYCSAARNAKCYKNTEGTACDVSSSAVCSFQSFPEYCEEKVNMACTVNAGGTGCDTASAAGGCKWVASGGECYDPLICYKTSAGTECDSGGSDTGCTWHPGTPAHCQSSTESCYSNATGDGCTGVSILEGCVWKEGSGNETGNETDGGTRIIHVPVFLLLVLFLFSL